jgi:hypothetical protein
MLGLAVLGVRSYGDASMRPRKSLRNEKGGNLAGEGVNQLSGPGKIFLN